MTLKRLVPSSAGGAMLSLVVLFASGSSRATRGVDFQRIGTEMNHPLYSLNGRAQHDLGIVRRAINHMRRPANPRERVSALRGRLLTGRSHWSLESMWQLAEFLCYSKVPVTSTVALALGFGLADRFHTPPNRHDDSGNRVLFQPHAPGHSGSGLVLGALPRIGALPGRGLVVQSAFPDPDWREFYAGRTPPPPHFHVWDVKPGQVIETITADGYVRAPRE